MASLDGLVDDWDASSAVRERLRVHGCLFLPAPREAEPSATVACGEKNFEVLKHMATRLQTPDGQVGMFAVPGLQRVRFSADLPASFVLQWGFLCNFGF